MLSIFALPSMWTGLLGIVGLLLFPRYWEFLFILTLNELYYGSVMMIESPFYTFLPFYGIAVFALVEVGRSFLRQGALRSQ